MRPRRRPPDSRRAPARLRHSLVDWGSPAACADPAFASARGTSVTLGPGDTLYLPAYWFHYIKSLSATAQCSKMVARATTPEGSLQVRSSGKGIAPVTGEGHSPVEGGMW